jgi:flagellar protein FlaG
MEEFSMEAKLRQVQQAMVESWMPRDHSWVDPSLVQPAVNSEARQMAGAHGPNPKPSEHQTDQRDSGGTGKRVDGNLLEEVQSYLTDLNIHLSFSVHYKTRDTVVQVIDNHTGEIIRQIPSDDLLHLKERMNELRGMLFDQRG